MAGSPKIRPRIDGRAAVLRLMSAVVATVIPCDAPAAFLPWLRSRFPCGRLRTARQKTWQLGFPSRRISPDLETGLGDSEFRNKGRANQSIGSRGYACRFCGHLRANDDSNNSRPLKTAKNSRVEWLRRASISGTA